MNVSFSDLLALARDSVQSPRDGARRVLGMDLPVNARWAALAFAAVASAILTHLSLGLMGADPDLVSALFPGPVSMALMQGVVMLVTALLAHGLGRWRGGRGSLSDAILLMAWLQFILLCLQVVQLVAVLLLPPLAEILGLVGLAMFFWLLTGFVAELHGFTSMGRVFAAILGTMILIAFVLSLFLVSSGGV